MKHLKTGFLITVGTIAIVYFLGPKPPDLHLDPILKPVKSTPEILETDIKKREANTQFIKPDNQARIIWADSLKKQKTPFSIVYLHGFSASWKEGDPVHINLAKKFGCNLYIPRLSEHGLDKPEPLLDLDAEQYLTSASQAISEAAILGEKVIVMSTSTGGTLSLYLAAHNPEIFALIMFSPNIALYDEKAFVLSQPWGLQLARQVVNSHYYNFGGDEEVKKYWNTTYRIEGLITLKSLVDHTMKPEVFEKVKQPVLLCYYYKNEEEQDPIVSVKAMQEMFVQLGTPNKLKKRIALPEVKAHALACDLVSKDIPSVEQAAIDFMQNVLLLPPVR